jgi:hypothetical protein
MSSSEISNNPSELFISSNDLSNASSSPSATTPKMIPLKILPTSVPQVVTTTKTLRRCCGFSLAIVGFLFYCLRAMVALWLIVLYLFFTGRSKEDSSWSSMALLLEAAACSIGIAKFLSIMRNPKLTLRYSNAKVDYLRIILF